MRRTLGTVALAGLLVLSPAAIAAPAGDDITVAFTVTSATDNADGSTTFEVSMTFTNATSADLFDCSATAVSLVSSTLCGTQSLGAIQASASVSVTGTFIVPSGEPMAFRTSHR